MNAEQPSREDNRATTVASVRACDDVGPDAGVRPYYVTRGRTRTDRPLGIQALVQQLPGVRDPIKRLTFELREIALVCSQPTSLAEVAARVGLPIGVVRVLVADLVDADVLQVHDTPERVQDDISLIQRLIHGVRAL